ncbi:MAG TPA: hypothetical protein PLX03_05785, partial [Candidatus Hydrogenedentes bacterium]|nr:hypothetical protein [Candidatus Hydrogenedentota bacterium]
MRANHHDRSKSAQLPSRRDFIKQAGQAATGCWTAGHMLGGTAAGVFSVTAAAGAASTKKVSGERLAIDG